MLVTMDLAKGTIISRSDPPEESRKYEFAEASEGLKLICAMDGKGNFRLFAETGK